MDSIILILQMKKPRLTQVKHPAQGSTIVNGCHEARAHACLTMTRDTSIPTVAFPWETKNLYK